MTDTRLSDNPDLHRLAEALANQGHALTPSPEFTAEWTAACPLCVAEGNTSGTMTIYLSDDRYAGSVAYTCTNDGRHKLYNIGATLQIRTDLMDAIDAGRAELHTVLAQPASTLSSKPPNHT